MTSFPSTTAVRSKSTAGSASSPNLRSACRAPARRNRQPAVAADLGAVDRRQAQKAERRQEGDQRNQKQRELEVADRDPRRAGDHREQCRTDRDAKAARQLLRNAANAG